MENRFYEDDLFSCEIINGVAILHTRINTEITYDVAKIIVERRLKFFNGKSYPLLIDLKDIKYATKEGRDYLNKEGLEGMKAGALLTHSKIAMVFFNLFIQFGNIPFPAKVFTNKDEAIKWLQSYTR